MKQRKLLALGMATLMAMSSTVMAFADPEEESGETPAASSDVTAEPATGSLGGDGTLEGYVDTDVFTVTLPTDSMKVDFKLDPQELLLATADADAVPTLDEAALAEGYGSKILFTTEDGYASKSADITVVNKSTFDVDVTVEAKLSGLKKDGTDGYDVKVLAAEDAEDAETEEGEEGEEGEAGGEAAGPAVAFGSETAISMKLTSSTNTITGDTEDTPVPDSTTYLTADATGIKVTATVPVSDEVDDAYKYTKEDTGKYSYGIDATAAAGVAFNEVVFNLEGDVNKDANWTNFSKDENAKLSVAITYTVKKHSDEPDSPLSVSTISKSANSFSYTLPEGATKIKSMVATKVAGGTVTLTTASHYKLSGTTVTITNTNLLTPASYSKITVTFDDANSTTAELTIQ